MNPNTFKTPLRQKRYQLHSAIRSQQLETMRKQVRQHLLRTQKKKQQSSCYSRLLMRLDLDCCDEGARLELERMFFQQGFVFDEERVAQLLPVIKELWGRVKKVKGGKVKQTGRQDVQVEGKGGKGSGNRQKQEQGSYQEKGNEKRSKEQTHPTNQGINESSPKPSRYCNQPLTPQQIPALLSLQQLISLLAYNTKTYPQYGTIDSRQTISLIFSITKQTPSPKLQSICYKFLLLLLRNPKNKPTLIQLGILDIMALPQFIHLISYTETILSVLFNFQEELQFKQQYIRQLKRILEHFEGIFVTVKVIGKFEKFVVGLVRRLGVGVGVGMRVGVAGAILAKLRIIKGALERMGQEQCRQTILGKWEVYARCLEKVLMGLTSVQRYNQGDQGQTTLDQMIIDLFQPLWCIYYQNTTHHQSLSNRSIRQFNVQTQHITHQPLPLSAAFYQCFCPVLSFIFTHFQTRNPFKQPFLQLYWTYFTGNFSNLTSNRELLMLFLRHEGMFSIKQMDRVFEVYKHYQDDRQIHIQCLKILNRVRRLYQTSNPDTVEQYYHEFKAVTHLDQHTEYLLKTRPVPSDLEYFRFCQELASRSLEDKQSEEYYKERQVKQDAKIKEELSKSIRRHKEHLKTMMDTSGEDD